MKFFCNFKGFQGASLLSSRNFLLVFLELLGTFQGTPRLFSRSFSVIFLEHLSICHGVSLYVSWISVGDSEKVAIRYVATHCWFCL